MSKGQEIGSKHLEILEQFLSVLVKLWCNCPDFLWSFCSCAWPHYEHRDQRHSSWPLCKQISGCYLLYFHFLEQEYQVGANLSDFTMFSSSGLVASIFVSSTAFRAAALSATSCSTFSVAEVKLQVGILGQRLKQNQLQEVTAARQK